MSRDPNRYDFFVSYATKDNPPAAPCITRFIEALLAEHRAFTGNREFTFFFDKTEIRHGHDWQHTLHHGIAESRVFLAFISPSYFASDWCRKEWRGWIDAEIGKHVFSDGARPIYFIEVPGLADHALSPRQVSEEIARFCGLTPPPEAFSSETPALIEQLRRRQYLPVHTFYNEGRDALRHEDLRRVLADLAKNLKAQSDLVRHAAESANTIPAYNKNFSGRVNELLDLRERLKTNLTGVVCGVHGLGGIGKSELAYAYAHAFAGVYPGGRFEVPCEGKATIREAAIRLADFADFRAQITDEERKTPDTLFAAITACLTRRIEEKGSILLVLDNVTSDHLMTGQETDELTRLGPRLHLLMTTRKEPPTHANWLTLGELPEADAMDLLEKHRGFADHAERAAALTIVRKLGGFALAIELVAAYLEVHKGATYQSIATVNLETLAEDDRTALRRHNHERRLDAVLGPILDELSDAECRNMEFAAFLPPDTVALPWLKALLQADLPGALQPKGPIADPWTEIVSHLTGLALLTRSSEEEPWRVRVHRLVQEVLKTRMSPQRIAQRREAVNALARARDTALRTTTKWANARWEAEPLDALANLWAETEDENASWLLNQAGQRRQDLAEWTRAEPLMRRALAIDEATYGADHSNVAIRLNNLAALLQATNRLGETEPLMRRALAIDEASYGADHPSVARDLNNLAQLLKDTNRLGEAEPLMRRALAIDEASYGADHPKVAIRLNNLAQVLQDTNRLGEAEPLMRRALATDEASYGADHPSVARDLNNLAQLLKDTNRLGEAEPLMRRALAIDEASYGADHPGVARDLNNLALLLKATNRLGEAEPLMRRALAIDEASYGADHPDVAIDLNTLAQLLKDTNRPAEAQPLMRRVVEIFLAFTRQTGHQHPHLRAAVMNYAELLLTMGLSGPQAVEKLTALGPEPLAILMEQINNPNK